MIAQTAILLPTFVLVALIYAVWLWMFVRRLGHMKATPPTRDDFATTASAQTYFAPVEAPANNFKNLFEMPVLYFALVPLLLITHMANHVQVILAWAYVVFRAAHSLIHAGRGRIPVRFLVYLISCVILSAMWIGFAADILRAG